MMSMEENLTVRDTLARDRTHFANERTLLAYWRTSLAFIGLGAFTIKFFPSIYFLVMGIISGLFGIGLFIHGTRKFYLIKSQINKR